MAMDEQIAIYINDAGLPQALACGCTYYFLGCAVLCCMMRHDFDKLTVLNPEHCLANAQVPASAS